MTENELKIGIGVPTDNETPIGACLNIPLLCYDREKVREFLGFVFDYFQIDGAIDYEDNEKCSKQEFMEDFLSFYDSQKKKKEEKE